MTMRRVWLGSTGPFLFDDSVLYNDIDGVIAPDNQQAIATDGQILVQTAPSSDYHVVRKVELDNLSSIIGLGTMAYQNANAVSISGGIIQLTASSTVGGLWIRDAAGPGIYGIRCQVLSGTDRYNLFCDGTAPSYFGGQLLFAAGVAELTRNNLGLGTMATQNSNNVAVTGGNIVVARVGVNSDISGDELGTLRVGASATIGTNITAGGTITGAQITSIFEVRGIKFESPDAAGEFNVSYSGKKSAGTNRWNLFCDGTASNYLEGRLGIGTAYPDGKLTLSYDNSFAGITLRPSGAADGTAIYFFNTAGAAVGAIFTSATAVNYYSASDARLKHTIAPLIGALEIVKALNPIRFFWNADDSPGVGFLAHEVAEVVDDVVTGEKDALDAEGNIKPQMMDYSKLVPWLTAALQELSQQVQSLTARVAELEAA